MWCELPHQSRGDEAVQLCWRDSASAAVAISHPRASRIEPSILQPQQITEYPWWQELPPALGEHIRAFDDSRQLGEASYSSEARGRGWKAGGYASWELSDLQPVDCDGCGQPMRLLLSIPDNPFHRTMRIFLCTSCPAHPHRLSLQ